MPFSQNQTFVDVQVSSTWTLYVVPPALAVTTHSLTCSARQWYWSSSLFNLSLHISTISITVSLAASHIASFNCVRSALKVSIFCMSPVSVFFWTRWERLSFARDKFVVSMPLRTSLGSQDLLCVFSRRCSQYCSLFSHCCNIEMRLKNVTNIIYFINTMHCEWSWVKMR